MIVLRKDFKIYKPKLSIESCIILEQLFGSVTKPIESNIPSLSEQVFLLSLCLSQYNLSEDELYELIDDIDDLFSLIIDLYTEAGLINQDVEQNVTEEQETTSNDKIEEDIPQSFEEMCNDMLIQCMSIGLSRQEFYSSTFKEVRQYSEAYQQQQKNEAINRALDTYQLADLISISVGRLLSKEIKMPKFEVYYKHLLEDTGTSEEQTQEEDSGLTLEEMRTSALILEWAMSQQRKQEKKKQQEQKQEQETNTIE